MEKKSGDQYQNDSKYCRGEMPRGGLDWSKKPDVYKVYDAPVFGLPPVEPKEVLLHTVLQNRKSVRQFSDEPVQLKDLSYLLWASTGIQRKERGYEFRTAPSAGALYPVETYIVVNNVTKLRKGVYHYNIKDHTLEQIKRGDYGKALSTAALGQKMCKTCGVAFVWTAIFYRSQWKYKQRAYRYIYLDTGHIGQNLALSAVGSQLGSCQIGAFYDDEVNDIVEVDGETESAIYLSVVGHFGE
ncbi:MAG: SagB/ThcOx family dehydrogenase [Candidatus Methanofastidiosia archaeon]|jgi:SagB-type dehydrogenase family enzyme